MTQILVIQNQKFSIQILVNLKIYNSIIFHHKNEIFRNNQNSSFINKTNSATKIIKKISKDVKITKNHTKPKTTHSPSNLTIKNTKMTADFHKMKASLTIQKNTNPIRNTWENNTNSRIASKDKRFPENIILGDKDHPMITMKWMTAMKIVITNHFHSINQSYLDISSRIIINPKLIISKKCMKIVCKVISMNLREGLKVTHINIPIIRWKKISIKNIKMLTAKIFLKMNIIIVLPKINKSRNAASLIIKIKNLMLNLNVSYKKFKLKFNILQWKKNFKNNWMINMNQKTKVS